MGFLDDISNKNEILRWVVPIGIGVVVMVLALLLRNTIYWRLHRWAAKTETKWDDVLIHSTRLASMLWCFFLGIYTAVEVAVVPASWEGHLDDIVPILFVAMGIYTGAVIVRVFIEWYIVEVAEKTASPLDDMIMGALKWIVPLIAFFLGLVLVLDMLDIESLETKVLPPVKNWLRHPGPQIALLGGGGLALVLLATAAIPKVIREAVTRSRSDQSDEEVNKRADTLSGVLVASLQAVIIAVVLFMMLSEIGLNISPIIAGVGVIGIAIGFGAQSLVKDIIAGLFIIMENQYRKGDVCRFSM